MGVGGSWEDGSIFCSTWNRNVEISYAALGRRLKDHGLEATEASITAKLNRGTFAATFFLATMLAIGRDTINLGDV